MSNWLGLHAQVPSVQVAGVATAGYGYATGAPVHTGMMTPMYVGAQQQPAPSAGGGMSWGTVFWLALVAAGGVFAWLNRDWISAKLRGGSSSHVSTGKSSELEEAREELKDCEESYDNAVKTEREEWRVYRGGRPDAGSHLDESVKFLKQKGAVGDSGDVGEEDTLQRAATESALKREGFSLRERADGYEAVPA